MYLQNKGDFQYGEALLKSITDNILQRGRLLLKLLLIRQIFK